MDTVIFCWAATYIVIGLYGCLYLFRGLKAIFRRSAIIRYNNVGFSWREPIYFIEQSATLTDSRAMKWGGGQVVSGLLASVPWLIPMIWDVPLDWYLFITPITGIGLNIAINQISGRRANA